MTGPVSSLDEIIAKGDAAQILSVAWAARLAASNGIYCQCVKPSLRGYDLMCGNCLRENESQIERAEARIRGLHSFEARSGRTSYWCRICAMPEDDPRHGVPS